MDKNNAVLDYKTSLSIFKNWVANGLITSDELLSIDTMLAKKYGIPENSIYREKGEPYGNRHQKQPLCVQNL